jgi:serine/threonine protein kinase
MSSGLSPPDPSRTVSRATIPAYEPSDELLAIPGYEILGRLAPGGMGVVYRARQVALNRTVALKVIRAGAHAGPQERARFRVEAEAVASLSHPHVIPIYDCGEWDAVPYLAMEFAEGGSLADRLAGGPMPAPEAAALVETLARAVQFVHERGLIHRDLKPANILLTDQGVPKLADFGLAKRLDQDQGLTRSRAVLGTASYMAPEQAAGDRQALGPAADVYALGAILYETLTGQPPFRAETYELTIHQVLSEEPQPPRRLRPEVPAELEGVCLRCLEKEPGRRFASALALAEDLRRFREGEPTSTQALGPFEWHARAARRAGYEILDTLASGTLGVVYKARHLSLKRVVALTMITSWANPDPDRRARLRAQAEAVAQLHHPNIVDVYDFGEHNGEPYIAREYVEGDSLAAESAGPPKPPEQTAALVEKLARAVHHAHQRGIVHGGLKPSRVLLGADGTCKITGFGLASVWRDEPIDPATDLHALGAILYELLSGRPPDGPEPPHHWRPEVPRGLEAICLRCLEQDPARRYPSAAALAEDLRRFRGGEVLFIDDLDDWAQQERWARRAGYEIVEVLGRGREGFTYKARQVAIDRVVVLRRMTARDRFVPAAKARFRWEAALLAGLRHPNFVPLYDQGEQNDLVYFAREFVDGPSLTERVAESPLAPRAVAELVETLARAVQAAHTRGAVHGGLNPDEVRLTPAGVPKVTSFRSARLPGADPDEPRPESEVRRLACCLAPEQLEPGRKRLQPATDVYALGAILYTLLTGQAPFPGPSIAEALEQVRSQPPGRLQSAVPPDLEAICLRCLEKSPGRRPASAEALADELRGFLSLSPQGCARGHSIPPLRGSVLPHFAPPGGVSSHRSSLALSVPLACGVLIQFHHSDSPSATTSPLPALAIATKPSSLPPTQAALTSTRPRLASVTATGDAR